MTTNTELSNSAFNILLQMTTPVPGQEEPSHSKVRPSNQRQTTSTQIAEGTEKASKMQSKLSRMKNPRAADPVLYYSDGTNTRVISKIDLVETICQNPTQKHFLWTRGESVWRPWHNVPSLLRAVKQQLQEKSHHKVEKTNEIDSLHSKPKQTEEKKLDSSSASPIDHESLTLSSESINDSKNTSTSGTKNSSYWSVPETVFTHFEIHLDQNTLAKPFLDLDQDIEKGGIFVATERVLNVGDYIQLALKVKGETFLTFEAPIKWLRIPNQNVSSSSHRAKKDLVSTEFDAGVAVYWPTLTNKQRAILKQWTKHVHCELYIA